ncbi:aminotransferase class III-fold pyridoxal phosphate-dependent enzyme [uncultured Roseobacter sp.]|uniref:aspartate aminotransferase family protein n=1 Tax=uncultured Roseobacter sp. TaxID=114847 RepID=UPI00260FE3C1|nr:aminotransferase class III-fold pyridoxal phosphate-dependent enzyme [uncultured Roseobacter sp.]
MSGMRPILDMNAFREGDSSSAAVSRRLQNVGAASVLFYREPIEMVGATGATMIARDGTRYLDFYNNVPSVGHTHPKVVEAVQRQIATLNTNTRYLVDIVDRYLDALKSQLPAHLGNVIMTCSGSEANDLALRVARAATGGTGVVVSHAAYHGNTALTTDVSPSALKTSSLPDWVVAIAPPGPLQYGQDVAEGFAQAVAAAIATLEGRGHAPAALLMDSIFSSDGVFADPPGGLVKAADVMRAAGGLVIADEVQPGFGRTGSHFWGFARHGLQPDILTMGKPMGNGFPMAAMAAQPDHLAAFCADVGYFNTFGGNPVAAAAGLAVLEVIHQEGLMENAHEVGAALIAGLRDIGHQSAQVGDVRGAGLFIGLDLIEQDSGTADPAFTVRVIDAMRDEGVMIGAAGREGATLKIRPPLCLTRDEADRFLAAFQRALDRLAAPKN